MALPPVPEQDHCLAAGLGYPEGVPDGVDYIPLFALLGSRQLTESEVKEIAEELANESRPEDRAKADPARHRSRHQPQAAGVPTSPGSRARLGRWRLAPGQA